MGVTEILPPFGRLNDTEILWLTQVLENQGYLTGGEDALGAAVACLCQSLGEGGVQVNPESQAVQGGIGGEERSVSFGQLTLVIGTDAVLFFHNLMFD